MAQDAQDIQRLISGLEGKLEALQRSVEQRRQFELLVTSVVDYAILMVDAQGRISSWNRGAERLKGYTAGEIIGSPYARFFTPEDAAAGRPQQLLDAALRLGSVEDEGWRLRKDGTRFWVNAVLTAVYDEDGQLIGYAKVTRDLTERRRTEVLKDQFLSILSHELRTPLNAILGFGTILEEGLKGPLNPEQQRCVEHIVGGADILLALIEDLLDMSRIQAGKFSIQLAATNFLAVATQTLDGLEVIAHRKAVRLHRDLDPAVPAFHADGQRLAQVLVNLVMNAIKFSPEGGTVRVTARVVGDQLHCRVSDEGRGIAAEDLPRLFHPFSQLDTSNTRAAGGTGLGLAISKTLVEAHDGQIGVESTPGQGSTFWFSVPLTPVSAPSHERVIPQAD